MLITLIIILTLKIIKITMKMKILIIMIIIIFKKVRIKNFWILWLDYGMKKLNIEGNLWLLMIIKN